MQADANAAVLQRLLAPQPASDTGSEEEDGEGGVGFDPVLAAAADAADARALAAGSLP
jgi:hypothetical protein